MQIVPDVVKPEEDEVPVKQYDLALLRSRIKGERAEGRLLLTTKRLIFRAAGNVYGEKLVFQNEFAIDEIAGIEVKKHRRVSPLNIILCSYLSVLVAFIANVVFGWISSTFGWFGTLLNFLFSLAFAIPFFVLNKSSRWPKFISVSIGYSAAYTLLTSLNRGALANGKAGAILALIYVFAYLIFSIIALLLVCTVRDLQVTIKTKGAGIATEIRRKERGILSFSRQPNTYTGFAEVLPWKDALLVAEEAGAIIKDIQLYGSDCVDKWKTL